MNRFITYFAVLLFLSLLCNGCGSNHALQKYGNHYQKHQDYHSLKMVVELLPADADSSIVRKILGEPIDFGFDYRYLIDSIGPGGCVIGAVFHINEYGKIDQKWLDEICE